jgi:hypothetical protein
LIVTLGALAAPAGAATVTVDGAGDASLGGDAICTLREAIVTTNSNAQVGGAEAGDCAAGDAGPVRDVIEFALGAGVQTIAVGTVELPAITDPVEIDGSQGSEVESQVRIELDGSAVLDVGTNHGLFLTTGSSGSYVHNVAVFDFPDDGIHVFSDDNVVEWAIAGMDEAGTEAKGNGGNGITVRGERNAIAKSAISGNDLKRGQARTARRDGRARLRKHDPEQPDRHQQGRDRGGAESRKRDLRDVQHR